MVCFSMSRSGASINLFRLLVSTFHIFAASIPNDVSRLKSLGSTYVPVCQARKQWQMAADMRHSSGPLIMPINCLSTDPRIFLPAKYFPYKIVGICGARNRSCRSCCNVSLGCILFPTRENLLDSHSGHTGIGPPPIETLPTLPHSSGPLT